eukprot:TRINITY_DN1596_c0_g1_i2.p1 TRINITY_DN1596_c0_g1~~TRINITY_DN1596_c0_g1_i2.p1  ORF type:complete len:364 (-),score=112.70 TRINITY_DN1596_c0_g1_i2:809-1900(-)
MDLSNPLVKDLLNEASVRSLDAYDVIGFDVDHCLVQYNVPSLYRMTYHGLVDTLIKDKGYPKSMHELTEVQMNFPMNGTICDYKHGCMVKLSPDNEVLRAYKGFRRLGPEELREIYGNPPCMKEFTKEQQATEDYFTFLTYFDPPFTLLFAAMQDLAERKVIAKTIEQLKEDLWYAHKLAYVYWDYEKKTMEGIATYGTYYPHVVKSPELYIKRREGVRELLAKLREKGKKLFMLTNSHYDYCDVIMSYAFGKDWKKLFDLCITCGKKPNFFKNQSGAFYRVKETEPLFCGEEAKAPLELNNDYLTGNYKGLEMTFEKALGRTNLKYAYLGDNYMGDCYWTAKLPNWDGIAVVEELSNFFLIP